MNSDFFHKLDIAVSNLAPRKAARVKNNTEWVED